MYTEHYEVTITQGRDGNTYSDTFEEYEEAAAKFESLARFMGAGDNIKFRRVMIVEMGTAVKAK